MRNWQLLALTVTSAILLGSSVVLSTSVKRPCKCAVSGDPHYYTFDGEVIHFMGTCKYILATNKPGSNLTYFTVEVKNEHRGNKHVSYTRMLDLKLKGVIIRLLPSKGILVNKIKINLPVKNYLGFSAEYSAGWTTITTEWGLSLEFDGNHRIYLRLPSTFSNELTGICGDCNRKKDDMRTKSGRDVSSQRNKYNLIGQSYQVCDDSDKPEKCVIKQKPENCDLSQVKSCNILNNLFKTCKNKIGQNSFNEHMESCKIDVCAYRHDKKLVQTVLCKIVESVAKKCEDADIFVDWRKTAKCEKKCSLNEIYSHKTPTCQATCINRSPSCNTYAEGCICKVGYMLSGEDCVPKSKCGCMNGKMYMKAGEETYAKNCVSKSRCLTNGTVEHTQLNGCQVNRKCIIYKNKNTCACNDGYVLQNDTCIKFVCDKPIDVQFLVELNGIGKTNLEGLKHFVTSLIDSFTIGLNSVKVGVWGHAASWVHQYIFNSDDPEAIMKAINKTCYVNRNYPSLYYIFNNLKRYVRLMRAPIKQHNAVVAFVGSQLYNQKYIINTAKSLRKSGLNIYIVEVGEKVNKELLKNIVSNSSSDLLWSENYFNLNKIKAQLLQKICSVNPCKPNPCKNGGTCINTAFSFSCQCPQKYFGLHCTQVKKCYCSTYGEHHYRTFDGQTIRFTGPCRFTLVAPKNGSKFSVDVMNDHRKINTRLVDMTINSIKIRLSFRRILINSEERHFPVINYKQFKAYYAVGWIIVTTSFGLTLKFDGAHRITVSFPLTYANKLIGICGDCNGKQDDFRTKSGVDVSSQPNKLSLIGNSYLVNDPEESCNATAVVIKKCNTKQMQLCDIINDSPFNLCARVLGEERVRSYVESCQIDACKYKNDVNIKKIVCQSIEAFVTECENANVPVNWRGIAGCPKFCSYTEKYNYRSPSCRKDCLKQEKCSTYVEGCSCSHSAYLYSGTSCTYKTYCGCTITNIYFKRGYTIYDSKCKNRFYCRSLKKIKKYSVKCAKNGRCGLENGQRKCVCANGYYGGENYCYSLARRGTFITVNTADLKAKPWDIIEYQSCFYSCYINKHCKAYTIDYTNRLCKLYNIDASENATVTSACVSTHYHQRIRNPNTVINGVDFKCSENFKLFAGIKNKEECRTKCLKKGCFAFSYAMSKNECKIVTRFTRRFYLKGIEGVHFVGFPSKI